MPVTVMRIMQLFKRNKYCSTLRDEAVGKVLTSVSIIGEELVISGILFCLCHRHGAHMAYIS